MKGLLIFIFFTQYSGYLRFLYKVKINDDSEVAYQSRPCVYYHSSDSTLYVVFEDDRDRDNLKEIYFSYSKNLGRTWLPNKLISSDQDRNDYYPFISVSRNGVIHIVWQSVKGNKGKVYYTRSSDKGNTFTPPDTLPGVKVIYSTFSNVNFGPQPKIACDPTDENTLYVVWADDRTGLIQIRIARSLNGGESFEDLGILDKNLGNVNRNPYVIVDDSGYVHVAWARGNSGTNQDPHPDIGYNFSKDKGNTFLNNDIFVVDNPGYEAYRGSPSITYNRNKGEILVVWEDSRGFPDEEPHIYFAKRVIEGDSIYFKENIRADISSGKSNYRPVFFIDPEGKGVCAWHSNLIGDNYFSILMAGYSDTLKKFSPARIVFEFDTTFTGTTNANFGNAFYPPSIFVDTIKGLTNFFLVWQDLKEDSMGNIYFIRGELLLLPETDEAIVFPNPFKPATGHSYITFINLFPGSKVEIFDVNANKVKIFYADEYGFARWDGRVASGVYTYLIKDKKGNKKIGKIAIVR